jgi:hypothetical protein
MRNGKDTSTSGVCECEGSVDAYIARIAIRIMSDTRDGRKTETKIKGVLQDTQDPRPNCKIYDTGNIIV